MSINEYSLPRSQRYYKNKCDPNKKYAPNESISVKDPNALEMCVGQLRDSAFGEEVYPSVYEKAAFLLIQLIKKHPSFLATFVFLKINGQLLTINQKDAINLVVYIATYDRKFDQLIMVSLADIAKNLSELQVVLIQPQLYRKLKFSI